MLDGRKCHGERRADKGIRELYPRACLGRPCICTETGKRKSPMVTWGEERSRWRKQPAHSRPIAQGQRGGRGPGRHRPRPGRDLYTPQGTLTSLGLRWEPQRD